MSETTFTPEARAVRSGAAAGGATELGKFKLGEWFKAAKSEIGAKIGLSKAESQIKGNKEASPKIGELGLKVINGIGTLVEKRGEKLEGNAYKRTTRASEHERKLEEIRQKPIEAEKLNKSYQLSNMTLEMHNLPGRVENYVSTEVSLVDKVKEKWHGFWSERDNRVAERDLSTAVKYGDYARTVQEFAGKIEDILGDKSGRGETLKTAQENAATTLDETTAIKEKLADQFGRVVTEGATIGESAINEVNQIDVNQAGDQMKVAKEHQERVAKTGI